MTPYADFLYFGVLLYVVIPALVLGFAGWLSWRWVLLATLLMLAVRYGGTINIEPRIAVREIWIVAVYALFEWALALAFLRVRARADSLAAFVILNERPPGSDFAVSRTLRAQLAERLPSYMLPRKFLFMETFPMTPNGKADLRKLAALLV